MCNYDLKLFMATHFPVSEDAPLRVSVGHVKLLFCLTLKKKCVSSWKLKPIFHWKLCSRWLPNASECDKQHEIYMACLCSGLAMEVTQIFAFALGVT